MEKISQIKIYIKKLFLNITNYDSVELIFCHMFFLKNMKNNKEGLQYNKEYSIAHTHTHVFIV